MTNYIARPARPQANTASESFHHWDTPDHHRWLEFWRAGNNRYLLRFAECADFQIDFALNEVEVFPTPETTVSTIEHLYLNQVLPLMQSHQGQLVLHGSAVVIEGEAVAFLGQSGAGKSTLATSFALAGHPFLTDDGLLLAPSARGDGYRVLPSHPTVRLWEDSRDRLLGDAGTTVMPVQYNSKSRIVSSPAMPYCDEPRPLRALYLLGLENSQMGSLPQDGQADDKKTHIRRLTPAEAVISLINHSFVLDIEAREVMARHFDQFTGLASQVPCFSLSYPQRYDELNRVQQSLKRHIAAIALHTP